MSVRAYRVVQIKMAEAPSFNVWHDKKLVRFLNEEELFFSGLSNGTGLVDISVETLESAIEETTKRKHSEQIVQCLQKDRAIDKKNKEESTTNNCFEYR